VKGFHGQEVCCTDWSYDGQTWRSVLVVTPKKTTCLAESQSRAPHNVIYILEVLVLAPRQLSFIQLLCASVLASGCP
jgi:hypothetical protein